MRQGVLCLFPAIAKTLSLNENVDFAPACGLIEARQFLKIQARPENPEPDSV